ncbi:neutral/alkaline non-lysosomal ceramidase N-terminal domain-containing protein [Alkalimarinus sediminis]|uniref:Neutral ceramidase n=1 Tax=Alkalimarinus sediminis TaxID=1632866 RepID=A0A9E8KRE3_9ALTE|nr:neutral/alkaline non-lysosomal ceramidase N-terminal domain-containing protein [Alkalimarinus sediminis]UZW76894.1 neutral/alkaline non-lysosomal ceramidase N-terminal domain-containing protein [Alkalimarinus sediminis]
MRHFPLLLLLWLIVGCTEQHSISIQNYKALEVIPPTHFMAGAATVDITPPPGYLPRAGYALWSNIGEGVRTRLYARVYYLRDIEGDSHLVVQTDLTAGSRVLHTKLGEVLAQSTDINASNITITATHSHSAPGQILGSQFYNKHISHKSGFASGYFDFLVEQISNAAITAYQQQRPAKLATGKIDIWGHTRNRSIEAHIENRNVANKSTADNRTFHRVDPSLYMVRIDALTENQEYEPLGAFASFSIHGTALPQQETLFNADVWAYIHKDWERFITNHYNPSQPVHVSAFEGAHADTAPAQRFGMAGYIEAKRIGQGIAKKVITLYEELDEQLTDEVDISSAIRHINIREENAIDGYEICSEAAAGMTLAAAPQEHTSPVIGYLPFFKQGSRRWGDEEDNCQGRKRILGFSLFQPLFEPKDSFPDYVLFQLVKINDLVMVPLPFEVTTESGNRLSSAIKQQLTNANNPVQHVMVSSLAGGYTGYVTTPEEYGRQYYEGGHTLYGKQTLPYLVAQSSKLAHDMLNNTETVNELPDQWQYRFEVRRFLPQPTDALGKRATLQSPTFTHASTNQEGQWEFSWLDVNASKIQLNRPLLSIETRVDQGEWTPLKVDGIPVNDEGYDMAVRITETDAGNGMAEYSAYWYNPLFDGEQREYRFVVQPRDQQPIFYSPAFN